MKILGISCFYHDGAAALIMDGKLIAAAEEERFSRVKHDSNFPEKSINFCLETANIKPADLDYIVFYEKPFLKFERLTLTFLATTPRARKSFIDAYQTWFKDKLWIKSKIASKLKVPIKKIVFSGHHISHGASSFYCSPFEKAAILTSDGVGEWTTTAWGQGNKNKMRLSSEIKFPHSLGLFYSAFTQFLGFEINEGEYKVMGLAPFGKPIYTDRVEKLISQSKDGSFKLNLKYFNFHISEAESFTKEFIKLFGVPPVNPRESDKVKQVYADIAASAQKVLEDKLVTIAKYIQKKTKDENLVYAGGVALNGVANWRIFKESGFKNIYIHPAAGDSGGALGAAFYFYHHVLGNKRNFEMRNVYWGRQNTDDEIEKYLDSKKIKHKKYKKGQLGKFIAKKLAEGKVVGWVRGRFEWGPRALGSRSILADPRNQEMKDIVNSKIKFREGFRPFAPVTLIEFGDKYFDVKKPFQKPLEFMLMVVPVKKKWRKSLGAITHVDGTARPQFITKEINLEYYNLIKEFGKITGIPVLLNTSFNLKGEPIVNSCEEAYTTFMRSGLDILVLENYVIEK